MADASSALFKAVLAALKSGLSCSVYDKVPKRAAYPYVTINTIAAAQEDALNDRRSRYFVYLSVWSRADGQHEVLGIMSDIDAALHHNKLALDAGRVAGSDVTRKSTSRDADQETFTGSVTVEMLVEH